MKRKKQPSKIPSGIIEFSVILLAVIVSFFLWNSLIIYPIKLFVVIWHEISHGLATIFTGGKVHAIDISFDLGGACSTEDGNSFIVASAGYLGSLLIGFSIFITSYDKKESKWLLTGLAIALILFTANFVTSFGGGIAAILYSLLLFLSPRYFLQIIHTYLWRILGLLSCLYVVIDLKQDIFISGYVRNDAHLLAEITGLSAGFWGVVWIGISAVVCSYLLWYSYKRAK